MLGLFRTLTHEDSWPLTRGLLLTMGLILTLGAGAIAWRYHFEPRWQAEAEVGRLPGYEGGYRTLRVFNGLEGMSPRMGFRRLVCGTARLSGADQLVVAVLPYRHQRRISPLAAISQARRTRSLEGDVGTVVLLPRHEAAWTYEPLIPRLTEICRLEAVARR